MDEGPERHPEHEVDVHLQRAGPAEGRLVGEAPLPAGVIGGHPLHGEPGTAEHLLQGLLHPRPLLEHGLAVRRADVVEVDVDRQAGQVEDEEVDGRAALERQATTEERVGADAVEDPDEQGGLLVAVLLVPAVRREPLELRAREHQGTSAQERPRTRSGTTRFQPFTSLPGPRERSM